jgi:DNA-binding phage protein
MNGPKTEHAFYEIGELVAFTADQIHASKRNYSNIAREAQCAPSTVSKLMHGETRFPRAATILQILRALGWTVSVRGSNQ